MKIGLSAHNNGYELKEAIKKHLEKLSFEVIDFGTDSTKPLKTDYSPGADMAKWIITNNSIGIACCGSGVGISIATNRVEGIRCAIAKTPQEAAILREKNDITALALGSRNQKIEEALEIVNAYIQAHLSTTPTSCSYK